MARFVKMAGFSGDARHDNNSFDRSLCAGRLAKGLRKRKQCFAKADQIFCDLILRRQHIGFLAKLASKGESL
jgi:hypothetical protein